MLRRLLRLPLGIFAITWQSAVLALGQLRANKARALLTTLGIAIGVASITAILSILIGFRDNVIATFERYGTTQITIQPTFQEDDDFTSWRAWMHLQFQPRDFDTLLARCPSVARFSRIVST